jgi:lipoprotein-anchoring transpeptidase ErfK/SrfK
MLGFRRLVSALFVVSCLLTGSGPAWAHAPVPADPRIVDYGTDAAPGTVIVSTGERRLYLVLEDGKARLYPIGVGKQGLAWKGTATVERKAKWPRWRPTDNMIRREPQKYARYASGMNGGPGNPLGARALYLYKGRRDTMYRIHGTNDPASIGRAVSNGCIRLLNDHIADLYQRVDLGATVIVR